MGIDPVTHKPRADADAGSGPGARSTVAARLSHTAQWESARLEAEARLAREAKLRALASPPPPTASSVLDSPTSTLSFSESAMFAGAAHDMRTSVQHLQSYGENHFGGAAEPGLVGAGTFASALLDCCVAGAEQMLVAALPDGDQSEGEEDKGYWSSILNMVDSSVSSSLTSEVVTDPVMEYLPPATGEF
jgi:myb proto-oncogene protein